MLTSTRAGGIDHEDPVEHMDKDMEDADWSEEETEWMGFDCRG
jgi:hypothetical protein